jgi:dipeptidase E
MGLGETESIDRILIGLAGNDKPRALFLPTASMDDEGYIQEFQETYSRLGCQVDALRLHSQDDPRKIEVADLVYVGGGNTKMMLQLWRDRGIDRLLRGHLDKGKPVGGLSAGAICWFRVGNSDWPQYEGIPGTNTARLDCLGWIDLVACPHTKREGFRLSEFREMMASESGTGIGLDDGCAIQIRGNDYRILGSMPECIAHRIEWKQGRLVASALEPHDDFRPIATLQAGSVAE